MHAPALWIGIGARCSPLCAILLFFRGSSSEALGAVSDQSVGRHRTGQIDDPGR
jgi:hypothetical protein